VVKSSFRHSFATYAESLYSHRIDEKFLESIELENPHNVVVDRAVFIVSGHIGCWELAPNAIVHKMNTKGAIIGRRLKNDKLDAFITQQRTGENIAYLHHRNIADRIPHILEDGYSIGALLDHSATLRDSMFVPFFGLSTTFIKGLPMIAVRKDVPFLPAFLIRTEKSFKLVVYPMIYPDKSLKPKERIYDMALRTNQVYEDIIRKYPDQWYLIHKRFKKTLDKDGNVTECSYQ